MGQPTEQIDSVATAVALASLTLCDKMDLWRGARPAGEVCGDRLIKKLRIYFAFCFKDGRIIDFVALLVLSLDFVRTVISQSGIVAEN